jgi:alkaline phosphatase D
MKKLAGLLLSFLYLNAFANNRFFDKAIEPLMDSSQAPFYFGVASGDPDANSVILWSKLLVENINEIAVDWSIAADTNFNNIVQSGKIKTDTSSAFTINFKVSNLQPYTTYFYRFTYDGKNSPIGRTKTAPIQTNEVKLAVVSCNNYTNGYFNAFRAVAERNDIDAVVHLGDYIYEYGNGKRKKAEPVRAHIPDKEILSLQEYRSRYAQYRLDKDLQEAHRLHPFITIWDDHESANNAYKDGAQNHQTHEGEWETRKAIAKKVYFEWLPIEDNEEKTIIRKISYGNIADIFLLDERLEARSKQLDNHKDSNYLSAERFMIGNDQADWLEQGVKNSKALWKVIGNQVMFSELDVDGVSKKIGRIMDVWDGYPAERARIMQFFYKNEIKNIIIITGDIHSSWAFDLVADPRNKSRYNGKTGEGVIGAEFVCTSITSSNVDERIPRGLAKMAGGLVKTKKYNPHLRYNNVVDHGYMVLTLNQEKAKADWYYVKSVRKETNKFYPVKSWETLINKNRLTKGR